MARGNSAKQNDETVDGVKQLIEVEIGGETATPTAELGVGSEKAYGQSSFLTSGDCNLRASVSIHISFNDCGGFEWPLEPF